MKKGEKRVGVREEVEEGRKEVKGDGDDGREGKVVLGFVELG